MAGTFTTMTLGRMLDAYLEHTRRTGRPSSVRNVRTARKKLVGHFGSYTDVREIVASGGLEAFAEAKRKSGHAVSTINQYLKYFRISWQFVVDEKLQGHPGPLREVKRVRYLREERRRPTALTEAELVWLLAAAPSERCRIAMAFAAYAGLRHGEILHLTVDDLDLGRGVVHVTGKAGWATKNYEERSIPIGPSLLPHAEAALGMAGAPDKKTGEFWIFQAWRAQRLATLHREVSGTFRAIAIAPQRRPGLHMLRRTFATMLALRGTPLPVIRELMGHSSVEVTEGYIAVPDTALREACDGL